MSAAASIELPPWAAASEKRRAHIARVTALIEAWAEAMALAADARAAWRDAARLHDAMRDAPVAELRRWCPDPAVPDPLLHGPAVAARLASEGERRADVLEAIRWHTIGRAEWARTAATSVVFLLPIVIFTFLVRHHLLRGVTFGAVRR